MEAPNTAPDDRQESYLQRISHVQMGMAPRNLEEGLRMAQILSKSTLIPKDYQGNPGNVLIAIQMGIEIGLAPMQALQSIAVINGRPSLYGDGMLALVMNSPLCEYIKEPPVSEGVAVCEVKRRGQDPIQRTFSVDQAKKANLWGKAGPWQQYPERMLQMRARAFALRDAFPDVLRGLSMAEEQMDVPTETPAKVDPIAQVYRELQPDDQQWAFIQKAWKELEVPLAGRITHGKRFQGNPDGLIEMLVSMGAALVPNALAAPKPRRKRRARTTPSPDPVETAVAEVEARPQAKLEPNPAVCEHGTPIDAPCAECKFLAAELDAEAAKQTQTGKPPDEDLPF